jgi:hypothetical protein
MNPAFNIQEDLDDEETQDALEQHIATLNLPTLKLQHEEKTTATILPPLAPFQ